MFEKIEIFDKRYSELSERLYQPSVAGNPEEYQKIMKEIKSIEEIVLTYRKYKEAVQTEKDSLEILEETSDKELKELAQIELDEAKDNIKNLGWTVKISLLAFVVVHQVAHKHAEHEVDHKELGADKERIDHIDDLHSAHGKAQRRNDKAIDAVALFLPLVQGRSGRGGGGIFGHGYPPFF